MDLSETPHRRRNPLTGEWVLVSPHRLKRPWQGKTEEVQQDDRPRHDPACYLCPGNARAGGERNPDYTGTFVFTNDFSALLPDGPETGDGTGNDGGLFTAVPERGICRVVCFSPRHDLTLARLDGAAIAGVVETWCREFRELGSLDFVRHVQIFENKGALMGCSNPHPHGQIWATGSLPVEPAKEDACQREHHARTGRTLLQDYVAEELRRGERVVAANGTWAAVVPFWAKWPFEVLVAPLRPVPDMLHLTDAEKEGMGAVLREVAVRYDNVFSCPFPYTMGFHQAPTDGARHPHWHMHAHFYPPLLRSATVQKFMVGFEMLATPQRDLTPEQAADRLRGVPAVHHLEAGA